jgi:hypothetical protein
LKIEHNEVGLTAQDGSAPKFCPDTRVAAVAARKMSVLFMIIFEVERETCVVSVGWKVTV